MKQPKLTFVSQTMKKTQKKQQRNSKRMKKNRMNRKINQRKRNSVLKQYEKFFVTYVMNMRKMKLNK